MNQRFFILIIFGIFVLFSFIIYLTQDNSFGEGAILSLAFDDGYLAHYEIVYPLMEEYHFDGTLFILANQSGRFEGRELFAFEQAKEMQDSGWEIGSHTLNHPYLTELNKEEMETQLNSSKRILEENGLIISSMAFPFGDYNNEVLNITKKYYQSARPMEWGDNSVERYNQYKLKSKWVLSTNTPTEVCSWIMSARDRGLWLILDFHYVEEEILNDWGFST